MELSDAQCSALEAIAGCRDIWPRKEAVEAAIRQTGCSPSEIATRLDELIGLELIVLWKRHDGEIIVMTPKGADLLGIVTEERWEYRSELVELPSEPGRRARLIPTRVATAVPWWQTTVPDPKEGKARRKRRVKMENGSSLREKPVKPPIFADEHPPAFFVEPPKPVIGTQYVADWEGNEVTTDETKAKTLLAVPVEVETPGKKRRQRLVEAARKAMKATNSEVKPPKAKRIPPTTPGTLTGGLGSSPLADDVAGKGWAEADLSAKAGRRGRKKGGGRRNRKS